MLDKFDSIKEDDEIAENYIKIFCEFGIKSSRAFVTDWNERVQNYLGKMIKFTSNR